MPTLAVPVAGAAAFPAAAGIGAGALGGGLIAAPFVQEQNRYHGQKKYRKQSYALTRGSVQESLLSQYGQLQSLHRQQTESLQSSIGEIHSRAQEAAAATRLSASEGGIAGNSVSELLGDIERRDLEQQQMLLKQQQYQDQQLVLQGKDIQMSAYQKLLNAMGGPIQKPDYFHSTTELAKFGLLLA